MATDYHEHLLKHLGVYGIERFTDMVLNQAQLAGDTAAQQLLDRAKTLTKLAQRTSTRSRKHNGGKHACKPPMFSEAGKTSLQSLRDKTLDNPALASVWKKIVKKAKQWNERAGVRAPGLDTARKKEQMETAMFTQPSLPTAVLDTTPLSNEEMEIAAGMPAFYIAARYVPQRNAVLTSLTLDSARKLWTTRTCAWGPGNCDLKISTGVRSGVLIVDDKFNVDILKPYLLYLRPLLMARGKADRPVKLSDALLERAKSERDKILANTHATVPKTPVKHGKRVRRANTWDLVWNKVQETAPNLLPASATKDDVRLHCQFRYNTSLLVNPAGEPMPNVSKYTSAISKKFAGVAASSTALRVVANSHAHEMGDNHVKYHANSALGHTVTVGTKNYQEASNAASAGHAFNFFTENKQLQQHQGPTATTTEPPAEPISSHAESTIADDESQSSSAESSDDGSQPSADEPTTQMQYEVESVIGSRPAPDKRTTEYLVRWKDVDGKSFEDTWEPSSGLNAPDAIAAFMTNKHERRTRGTKNTWSTAALQWIDEQVAAATAGGGAIDWCGIHREGVTTKRFLSTTTWKGAKGQYYVRKRSKPTPQS